MTCGVSGCVTVPKHRLAVLLGPLPHETRRPDEVGPAHGPLDDDQRSRDQPLAGHEAGRVPRSRRRRRAGRAGPGTRCRRAPTGSCAALSPPPTSSRWPRVAPSVSTLRAMMAAVLRSCSTNVTTPAPAGPRLETDGTGTGVQVEEAQAVERAAPGLDGREQRLAHPVAGRARGDPARGDEAPPARRSSDDPRHGVLMTCPRTRSAGRPRCRQRLPPARGTAPGRRPRPAARRRPPGPGRSSSRRAARAG